MDFQFDLQRFKGETTNQPVYQPTTYEQQLRNVANAYQPSSYEQQLQALNLKPQSTPQQKVQPQPEPQSQQSEQTQEQQLSPVEQKIVARFGDNGRFISGLLRDR